MLLDYNHRYIAAAVVSVFDAASVRHLDQCEKTAATNCGMEIAYVMIQEHVHNTRGPDQPTPRPAANMDGEGGGGGCLYS